MTHSFVPLVEFEEDEDEDELTIAFEMALTLNEYLTLRGWLLDRIEDDPWALPALIAGETGARRGEALGFQRRDLSEDGTTLTFNRQVLHPKERGLGLTPLKTKNAYRTISISPQLGEHLRRHLDGRPQGRKVQFLSGAKHDLPEPDDFSKWFAKTARPGAGLPATATLHTLRHTHASILLGHMGVSDLAVSARLGHGSSLVTRRVYAHWVQMADDGIGADWESAVRG